MTEPTAATGSGPAAAPLRPLSTLEARVVGVLVEKESTVPDSYPLSLNSLVAGCNQKTARDPVISASESEVLEAIDTLKSLNLVIESSGGRVSRYEHNFKRVLGVPGQSVALLTMLMLRGPQTAAELRSSTERLHRFADISAVEGFLDELAARRPPLVAKLARAPGTREQRWVHLLCGEPVGVAAVAGAGAGADELRSAPSGSRIGSEAGGAADMAEIRNEQRRLADEVALLRRQMSQLAAQLGVDLEWENSR